MSYFVNPKARQRISMEEYDGSQNWFEVPVLLPQVELLEIKKKLEAGDEIAQYLYLLGRLVLDWSFTDAEGLAVPVGVEAFKQLGPVSKYMSEKILLHIQETQRTPVERKNSLSEPAAITSDAVRSPLNSSTSSLPNGSVSTLSASVP